MDHRVNVLYVSGNVPDQKHTFINREVDELQLYGIRVAFLVLNPFGKSAGHLKHAKIYKASFNPFLVLLSPFINLISYRRSLLFSSGLFEVLRGTDPAKVSRFRLFTAAWFLESALLKMYRSGTRFGHIHSHHLFAATVFTPLIASLLNTGYSLSVHTLSHYFKPDSLKRVFQKALFLRAVTSETLNFIQTDKLSMEVHYIPNCVNVDSFPRKSTFHTPGEPCKILAVGYFLDKKGFDILIKSCSLLAGQKVPFTCTIVGEGPEKPALEEMISRYGLKSNIQLLPYTNFEDLVPFFTRSTVLAVPSRDPLRSTRDGLPTVILEAMAMGVPVVASDFAGIPDAVIHGETGLLVMPENAADLAAAIRKIFEDPEFAQNLANNSSKWVNLHFSINKNIGLLANLFKHHVT